MVNGSLNFEETDKNGNVRMEANYEYFNNPSDYKVVNSSTVIWYFENGSILSTAMFKNNLFNGERVEYYQSGKIKDISYYKDGKKDGCSKSFNEDGSCNYPGYSFRSNKVFHFYKMGEIDFNNRSCRCESPKPKFNTSSSNANNTTNNGVSNSKSPSVNTEIFHHWAHLEEKPRTIQCSNTKETDRSKCIISQLKNHIINNLSSSTLEKIKSTGTKRLVMSLRFNKKGEFVSSNLLKNKIDTIKEEVDKALYTFPALNGAKINNSSANFMVSFPIMFN